MSVIAAVEALNFAMFSDEWLAVCPGTFMPEKGARGTHWKGDSVDYRTGLEVATNRTPFHGSSSPQLGSYTDEQL